MFVGHFKLPRASYVLGTPLLALRALYAPKVHSPETGRGAAVVLPSRTTQHATSTLAVAATRRNALRMRLRVSSAELEESAGWNDPTIGENPAAILRPTCYLQTGLSHSMSISCQLSAGETVN